MAYTQAGVPRVSLSGRPRRPGVAMPWSGARVLLGGLGLGWMSLCRRFGIIVLSLLVYVGQAALLPTRLWAGVFFGLLLSRRSALGIVFLGGVATARRQTGRQGVAGRLGEDLVEGAAGGRGAPRLNASSLAGTLLWRLGKSRAGSVAEDASGLPCGPFARIVGPARHSKCVTESGRRSAYPYERSAGRSLWVFPSESREIVCSVLGVRSQSRKRQVEQRSGAATLVVVSFFVGGRGLKSSFFFRCRGRRWRLPHHVVAQRWPGGLLRGVERVRHPRVARWRRLYPGGIMPPAGECARTHAFDSARSSRIGVTAMRMHTRSASLGAAPAPMRCTPRSPSSPAACRPPAWPLGRSLARFFPTHGQQALDRRRCRRCRRRNLD